MNNRIFYLILILLPLLNSCTNPEKVNDRIVVIDVPEDRNDGAELFDSLFAINRYVILETNDSSLINRCEKIMINKNQIFILDSGLQILTFDDDGKFVNTINHFGEGPGEYVTLTDFDIANDSIYVLDGMNGHLLSYDLNGRFGSSKNIYKTSGIKILENGIAMNNQLGWRDKSFKDKQFSYFYKMNDQKDDLYMGAPFNEHLSGYSFMFDTGGNSFHEFDNKIYTYFPLNDTIYSVSSQNGELLPIAIAHIENRSLPIDADKQTCETIRNSKTPKNIFGLYKWGDHVLFSYSPSERIGNYFYKSVIADIKTGNIVYCGGFNIDRNGFPVKIFSYDTDSDSIRQLLTITPSQNICIKAQRDDNPSMHPLLHEISEQINMESNPVLMFYDYIDMNK